MKKRESKIITYFTVIFIILLLGSIAFLWMLELQMKYAFVSRHQLKALKQVDVQAQIMKTRFHSIQSDLLFLSQFNERIIARSQMDDPANISLMEQEFLLFITNKKEYDQVRLLDTGGKEIIRVRHKGGVPEIIAGKHLQDKVGGDYFSETLKKAKKEIYISPFDLNMEDGNIQTPLQPVIRFGASMWGEKSGDGKKGVLILNYLGDVLISDFREATKTHPGVFSLLNDQGYWLYHDNHSHEWGFMFQEKKDQTLARQNPGLWKLIQTNDRHQVFMNNTLYTFRRVSMFSESCPFPWRLTILNTIPFHGGEMGFQKIPWETYAIAGMAMALIAFCMAKLMVRRKLDQETISQMSLYDALTGLPNRQLFMERAAQSILQCQRYNFLYAVFSIDLEGFKAINDTLGYPAGDEVLKKTAAILNRSLREADIVSRFGNDGFVLFLSRLRTRDDCRIVAEKILFELSRGITINGNEIVLGANMGIVFSSSDKKTAIEDFIQLADLTMYDAKQEGKNHFKIVEM